jgi:mRNA interferase MazF
MAFARGDVVLLPFPFRDRTLAKVRPAVVVSSEAYNQRGDVIVAAITTHAPRTASDVALARWREARLVAPSVVRMQLATVAAARVLHRPGRLNASDLRRVAESLRQVLDL